MSKKEKTVVFSKRVPEKVLQILAEKGIDPAPLVENFLKDLAGVTKCPVCGVKLNRGTREKK